MRSKNEAILDAIIRREGHTFTNDPDDRGGATKFGITQRTYEVFLRRVTTGERARFPEHVSELTESRARVFYMRMYVTPMTWVQNEDVRHLAIDCSINHGMGRAVKWLQLIVGEKPDGIVGPLTRGAVNGINYSDDATRQLHHRQIYRELLIRRFKFYAYISTDQRNNPGGDPDAKFLAGWINRACEFI